MAITFEQHQAALRRAVDAQDEAAVREIEAVMDTYPEASAYSAEPQQEAPQESLGYFDAESYKPENLYASAKQRVKGFAAGVGDFVEQGGNILEENVIGLRDGALRADQYIQNAAGNTSVNHGDSLDGLNEELAVNRRRQALVPDGIGKTLGGIGGEVVTAAPLMALGLPGGIIRGAAAGAAEGFALESLTNSGGLTDRAQAGAVGAAFGGAGGAAIPALGKGAGYLRRRGQAKEIYANQDLGHTAEGDLAMREAEEIGVPLDRVDAEGVGFDARKAAMDANQDVAGAAGYTRSINEMGDTTVTAGREGIAPGGDVRVSDSVEGTRQLLNESAEGVQKQLDANKVADDEAVTAAYKAVEDDIGKGTKLSVPNMRANLQTHIEELLDVGEDAAAKGLQRQLDRHAPEGADISVEGMMALRKGVSKLWKPNGGNSNRIIEEFKGNLDDTMSTSSLGGAGQQAVEGFKTATQTARANFAKYRKGTTAEQGTRLNADGNAAKTPTARMETLWKKGSVDDLRTEKAQFEGQPEALQELERAANAKVMDLLDDATDPKSGRFNSNKFSKAIKGWSDEFREEMLGKEGAEFLGKFERTAALQGRKNNDQFKTGSDTKRNQNQDDHWLKKGIDFFSKSTLARNPVGRGSAKVLDLGTAKVGNLFDDKRIAEDIVRLRNGQLPKVENERIQAEMIERLRAEYPDIGQGQGAEIIRRYLASVGGDTANTDRKEKLNRARASQK